MSSITDCVDNCYGDVNCDAGCGERWTPTESQDNELDAILGELCALGSQFERELNGLRAATEEGPAPLTVMGSGTTVSEKKPVVGPVLVSHSTAVSNNKETTRSAPAVITAGQTVRPTAETVSAIGEYPLIYNDVYMEMELH